MSVRVGIVGCGGVAKSHAAGYRRNGAEITALADMNKAVAETMARDYPGVQCFRDHKAMLESGLVDAVSVCTPPAAHEDAAVSALERGVPALVEKPLAHSVASAERIVTAADRRGTLLMTAFRHRFLPAMAELKRLVDEGRIGPPVLFLNVFCGPAFQMKDRWFGQRSVAGGGTLMDTSIHSVDLFRFLMGEVAEQRAVMHRHLAGTNVEDASVLILKSESGVVGSLAASWVAGDGIAVVDVVGQRGRAVYDYRRQDELRVKPDGAADWESRPVQASNGFAEETGHFLRAIRGEEALSCTGRDGLRAVQIVMATY